MAQESIIRIETALNHSLNEIDKLYTRKIQGDMHRCSAKCCDKTTDSIENVFQCIRICATDFDKVQKYLQKEYNQFQARVQRCVLECNDDVLDKASTSQSPSDIARFNRDYELCVMTCANKHLDLIPNFMNRVKQVLHKKGYMSSTLDDDPEALREPFLL